METKILVRVLVAASVFLSGCVVTPVGDAYYAEPVRVAPPPLRVEYPSAPPAAGHVWIGGYWNWGGVNYMWVPGRWEAPRPGYRYAPHRWERSGDHWRRQGGHWEHESPSHRSPPSRR